MNPQPMDSQLLSEEEKVLLASLEAERAHGSSDKDCVLM